MKRTSSRRRFDLRVQLATPTSTQNPPVNPPVKKKRIFPDSKTKAEVALKKRDARNTDLETAVEYCQTNNVRGQKAISAGVAGNIKDPRTINKRLDGADVKVERNDSRILLKEEEEIIVKYMKNRNRSMQGMNRKETTLYIHDILKLREHVNKKGGRAHRNLSDAAKKFMKSKVKELHKSFWRRVELQHPSLSRKRQGSQSAKRVLACTREHVAVYLDELAEELISLGIFENAKKISPGVWHGDLDTSRIFNHDEMPQFIDYGVSSSGSRGLVYAAKGEECKRYRDENRECVTIEPYVSLAGEMISVQVIFPGTCISSSMAPDSAVEKIKGLMVSTTDSGYQDGRTCLESHKNFAKELKKNPNVKFPVCVLTDGHSSRFDPDVMFYCRKEQLNQYVSLADATELLQQLDQVFANLHRCYSVRAEELFEGDYISKEAFMNVLADIWDEWTSEELLVKAAKRVGFTSAGIDINNMQTEKFTREEAVTSTQETPKKLPIPELSDLSPVNCHRGGKDYWMKKFMNLEERYKQQYNTIVSPEDVPGLLTIKKRKRPMSTKPIRVTQVHGSMEGKNI